MNATLLKQLRDEQQKLAARIAAIESGDAILMDCGREESLDGEYAQYSACRYDEMGRQMTVAYFIDQADAALFVKAYNAQPRNVTKSGD